jgi:hypothetical protein
MCAQRVTRHTRRDYVAIVGGTVYVPLLPPLPRDVTDLKARIIAAVRNIDAPMLTRVCGKNSNIVSIFAASPVMHTSNISSCQKTSFSFPVVVNNSIKVSHLAFLL